MAMLRSFEPVIGTDPKILILGSMPGVASLEAAQYYAHPRNQFWPIMGELLHISWPQEYDRKIAELKQQPIILWDSLGACKRQGSLDSAIVDAQPNDVPGLLNENPGIKLIAFNGRASEQYFLRFFKKLDLKIQQLPLPSTSPANARYSYQQKLTAWQKLLEYLD